MAGATVEYDPAVLPNEKVLIESKKSPFIEAFGWISLYVTVVEDGKKRRYFRVTPYSNRSEILGQFTADQIERLEASQIKNRLMGGDFQPKPLPTVAED